MLLNSHPRWANQFFRLLSIRSAHVQRSVETDASRIAVRSIRNFSRKSVLDEIDDDPNWLGDQVEDCVSKVHSFNRLIHLLALLTFFAALDQFFIDTHAFFSRFSFPLPKCFKERTQAGAVRRCFADSILKRLGNRGEAH